eukprot:6201336-Pleurochrysis_carterae.AAC.2
MMHAFAYKDDLKRSYAHANTAALEEADLEGGEFKGSTRQLKQEFISEAWHAERGRQREVDMEKLSRSALELCA